jgi:hypothetical protein
MPTTPEPVIRAPGFVLPAIGTQTGFAWDEIILNTTAYGELEFPPGGAGTDLPVVPGIHGKVMVTCESGRDLGLHKAPGRDGHRIVDKGLQAAKGKIELTAWTQEGLDRLPFIIDAFDSNRRLKDRTPIEVAHPTLAAHGIHKIVATGLSGPEPASDLRGAFKVTISYTQWFPIPRKKNTTHTVVAVAIAAGRFDPSAGGTNRPNTPVAQFNRLPQGDAQLATSPANTNTNP